MKTGTNEIKKLAEKFDCMLDKCILCPHMCKVNRKHGQKGFCKAGYLAAISSAIPHHGEEPPISGINGSGTIFFSHCNMKCVYCQNYQISQQHAGSQVSAEKLGQMMTGLQNKGCHNINLVSPTIWIPQIISAYLYAKNNGLSVPLVYNTGGYERATIIKMLGGIIDIYMPDIRYASDEMAERYSGIKNYVKNSRAAIKEMFRQVGGLKIDKNGIAKKGLLIRLLVLPGGIAGIKQTLDFIKEELSTDVYLSIMAQYHPEYKAHDYPELSKGVTSHHYYEIVEYAEKLGLVNGFTQEHVPIEKDLFRPDFNKSEVFKYYDDK